VLAFKLFSVDCLNFFLNRNGWPWSAGARKSPATHSAQIALTQTNATLRPAAFAWRDVMF